MVTIAISTWMREKQDTDEGGDEEEEDTDEGGDEQEEDTDEGGDEQEEVKGEEGDDNLNWRMSIINICVTQAIIRMDLKPVSKE